MDCNDRIEFASQPIRVAARRADSQDNTLIDDLGHGGKTPILFRAHDQTAADRKLIERYFSFGSFSDFWRLL